MESAGSDGYWWYGSVRDKSGKSRDSAYEVFSVYNHVLLKIGNEVVVEGMCKVIGRKADSTRGLYIGRNAKEARLVWNAPLQHEADPFLKESMDQHFGPSKWHYFYSVDKKNIPLVSRISKVIDRLKKRPSKFSFMKAKKD